MGVNSSGASSSQIGGISDDLKEVVEAWPELLEPVIQGILAMVRAARRPRP